MALVEGDERLLPREEPFAGEQVAEGLRDAGIDVRTGVKATAASGMEAASCSQLEGGDEVTGEEILVAVGRKPRTVEIGLDSVGIEPGGYLETDDRSGWRAATGSMRSATSTAGCCSLTWASTRRRIVADRSCGKDAALRSDGATSPRVTFTDPQVAAVGHTLSSAKEAGIDAREVDVDTERTAGGSFYGKGTSGTSRLVIDDGRGVIVGATFVGFETADFVHAATIAVVGEVPLGPSRPRRSVIPHPQRGLALPARGRRAVGPPGSFHANGEVKPWRPDKSDGRSSVGRVAPAR